MGSRSSVSAASFTKINILLDVIRLLNYISRAPNLRRKHSLYEADYHPTIRRIVHMRRSCLCRMGFCRIPFGGRGRFVLPASHVCCSFTSKTFQGNPFLQSRMFVFGEILKVMLSLLSMLAVFAIWHQSLVFVPFLMGLLGVSHLVFLVLLRVDYGR